MGMILQFAFFIKAQDKPADILDIAGIGQIPLLILAHWAHKIKGTSALPRALLSC